MRSFQASIQVSAGNEGIWRVLAAVTQWPQWLPTVTEIQAIDGGGLRPGSRFRIAQPKLRPAVWTVTAVDAPRCFTWESRSRGLCVVAEHSIEEADSGYSRVVLRATFRGPLSALAALLGSALTRRYLAVEAAAIKRRVEGGCPGPKDQ